jgi:hypothetical protein
MTRFVKVEQDGKTGYVNVDHVALVLPTPLIGTSAVIIDANPALSITIKGSVEQAVARLEGKDTLLLEA